jgi:cytochrome P450
MLINSVDEESHHQMTEQELFDEVMTIFLAGFETVATALAWVGVILYEHPEVLEKLQSEIDQTIGDRSPTFMDVPRLVYTRKVLMETMRMYTIVPFLPRSSNKPDYVGNYALPANAMILIFYYGVHHNPRVWDKPEVFDPERFSPEKVASQHPFAYMPFSAGPRKCAGEEFALMEAPLVMAMVLQKYDIHVLPNQTFTAGVGSTMYPRNGVKATLSLRKRQAA